MYVGGESLWEGRRQKKAENPMESNSVPYLVDGWVCALLSLPHHRRGMPKPLHD